MTAAKAPIRAPKAVEKWRFGGPQNGPPKWPFDDLNIDQKTSFIQ
jgi:hypothetical protein